MHTSCSLKLTRSQVQRDGVAPKLWQLARDKRRLRHRINHKWGQFGEMCGTFAHRKSSLVQSRWKECRDFGMLRFVGQGFLDSHLPGMAATNELSWCFPSAYSTRWFTLYLVSSCWFSSYSVNAHWFSSFWVFSSPNFPPAQGPSLWFSRNPVYAMSLLVFSGLSSECPYCFLFWYLLN